MTVLNIVSGFNIFESLNRSHGIAQIDIYRCFKGYGRIKRFTKGNKLKANGYNVSCTSFIFNAYDFFYVVFYRY